MGIPSDFSPYSLAERGQIAEFFDRKAASTAGGETTTLHMPITVRECRRMANTLRQDLSNVDAAYDEFSEQAAEELSIGLVRHALAQCESPIAPIILQAFDAMEHEDVSEFLDYLRDGLGWPMLGARQDIDVDIEQALEELGPDASLEALAGRLGLGVEDVEDAGRICAIVFGPEREPTEMHARAHDAVVAQIGREKAIAAVQVIHQTTGAPVSRIYLYDAAGNTDLMPTEAPTSEPVHITGRDPGDETVERRRLEGDELFRRMLGLTGRPGR